jgi:hypothetical protein
MDISTTGCQAPAAGRPDGGRRDGPSASLPPPGPRSEAEVMWLRRVLGRAVVGPQAEHIGHVHDLVVRPLADRSCTGVFGRSRSATCSPLTERWTATPRPAVWVSAGLYWASRS